MRETLIYLSHLDHEDTEQQVHLIDCFHLFIPVNVVSLTHGFYIFGNFCFVYIFSFSQSLSLWHFILKGSRDILVNEPGLVEILIHRSSHCVLHGLLPIHLKRYNFNIRLIYYVMLLCWIIIKWFFSNLLWTIDLRRAVKICFPF